MPFTYSLSMKKKTNIFMTFKYIWCFFLNNFITRIAMIHDGSFVLHLSPWECPWMTSWAWANHWIFPELGNCRYFGQRQPVNTNCPLHTMVLCCHRKQSNYVNGTTEVSYTFIWLTSCQYILGITLL